jgi:predicted nucleic acid-binding protein
VFEAVHGLLLGNNRVAANVVFEKFHPAAKGLTRRTMFAASEFRIRHKSRGLSYADAAGYALAREEAALFLTTDTAFRGLTGAKVLPK